MKMLHKAYIVYPGLGKTILALRDANFTDLEPRPFKDLTLSSYIGKIKFPNVRGTPVKEPNPDYPQNYFAFAKEKMTAGKIMLLCPKPYAYDLLTALGVDDYAWILPDAQRLEQLRMDCIARGDNVDYINDNLGKRYKSVLDLAHRSGKPVTFLKQGEYLADLF